MTFSRVLASVPKMESSMAPKEINSSFINIQEKHGDMRLFEWMTSAMMIGISIIVAVSPNAVHSGGFSLMANIGLTSSVIGVLFMAAGCLRMAALHANGNWPVIGPRLRAGAAAGGAFVWAQMLIALIKWSEQSGFISIGVSVYTFLVIGEVLSCHRAASDGIVKHVGPVD